MDIYVATKSDARKQILRNIRFKFRELSIDFKEKIFDDPVETIKYNSTGKNMVASKLVDGVVITFDTVVYIDGEVIGKPTTYDEAYRILNKLSGKIHKVYTGVAIGDREKNIFGYGETKVKYIELSENLIRWYLEREEYWRYAGGYRIQGLASIFIEYVEGDFFNVIGVPIQILINLLKKYGINIYDYLE
ncbi:MAG TPA: septum formation protein Maf [Thermoprotei archaeon]|nr:septum formation protein Maf [Thermoprotei archaeon]